MTGRFTFISYEGDDAGEVLIRMTNEDSGGEVHEMESQSQIQFLGFRPNEAEPNMVEPDEEEGDDEEDSER